MIIEISTLSWLAISVAFVAYFLLGAIWFTVLFKKPYLRSLGKENAPPQPSALIFIVGPAVCTLIITLCNAVMMEAFNIVTVQGSLIFAATVGFGYLFANTVNIAINPNIPRPIFYGIITGSYHLAAMMISCSILTMLK